MTATPPKPSLVKSTALSKVQAVTSRLNALMPTVPSAESPVTVYLPGTLGVGAQLNAPTSVFPAGAGYYGVWTAPDLNNGKNYTIQVECFGGGGGAGGGSVTTGGGGGGGGEYAAETYYPVKPGTNYVWVVGVPGSAGTANSDNNQGATAGGTGGLTAFDIAGTGVAGGVAAHGGLGGDAGNTGLGGLGGAGSGNTTEFAGGAGGTDLPGGGGGSGGQGGTDNPISLNTAGLLSAYPKAWYVFNDASSNGLLNDSSDSDNNPTPGSYAGGGFSYGQPGAPSQVPAYTGGGDGDDIVNPTLASAQVRFVLAQLNQQSGYILCPGFTFSGHSLTVSGWVTPDPTGTWGNTANGSRAVIVANCEGYANASTAGVALYFKNNGTPSHPSWQLVFYCANSSTSQTITVSVPPVAGTPVYVVATFSSGTMTLYVNGTSAGTASAGFSSVPSWPSVPYALTLGSDPKISTDWFFGYMSNFWFADGILSSAGVTQAYSGSGGSSTEGGAGGGASGGPAAPGGAGAAGSGSSGGAGGTPATQPTSDIGLNTPASAGIAGAAGNAGNSGITGAAGAGGGGAGSSTSPPNIITVQVPFTTAASYCGTDATGGAAGAVYNPVIQGTTGRLFTGGQSSDSASGSKNSLLILPPNLAASLQPGNYTVLRVTLTVTSANPLATQNALMQVGWSTDTFLPITYSAGDIAGSAGVVEIPVGAFTVTADLTESQLGTYLQNGGATALVLGPGSSPTFAAYNSDTAADFYTAVYGPGATDNAGNSLAPYLTVTYAQSTTVQQGSPGGAGAIRLTYLNQAQTLVGSWNSTSGLSAQGGQLTETSVVLGSANVTDGLPFRLSPDLNEAQREAVRAAVRELLGGKWGKRLGAGIAGAPGIIAGYTAGTTTTTQTTPGAYTFTVPPGVTSLNVQCWGAGAGGTGGNSSNGQAGGGGGAYAGEPGYAVTPGQVIHYTVGTGGTGDPVGTSSTPDGTASIFDTTNVAGNGVTANGGEAYRGSQNYGPGGSTAGNTVAFAGGNGGPLQSGQPNGSGGGGSAGTTGNGGGGSQGGRAGAAGSGGGAVGGTGSNTSSGSSGTAPGGGGGGAVHGSSGNSGGNGGNGEVSITYASSTALATSVATAPGTDGAGNPYPAGVMTSALQVNGPTSTQSNTVSGSTTTGTLTVSGAATVGAGLTVGTQLFVNGATGSANVEVQGNAHYTGGLAADGGLSSTGSVTAGTQLFVNASGSATMEVGGNAHITGGLQVDGSITTSTGGSIPTPRPSNAGTYTGGSPTGTGNLAAWAASVTTILNDVIADLVTAGVFS